LITTWHWMRTMATRPSAPAFLLQTAATILTGLGVVSPSELRSAELDGQLTASTLNSARNDGGSHISAADVSINEARWGAPTGEYVLAKNGRIAPAETGKDESGRIDLSEPFDDDAGTQKHNNFGAVFSVDSTFECSPSLATAEDVTRLVVDAARHHEVDVTLALAIATAESRLDRLRNSPKGARGPMQLMPETAARFNVSDVCDPEQNIDGGVRYLRELIEEFHNPLLVAAAYNAGEGRVREYGGIPPFKETVGYVAEVVNLQMRLSGMERLPQARGAAVDRQDSTAGGVITLRERRQWVGGVMHF
jgi:hypothetical protein